MKRIAVLLFWACVGFSNPAGVTWFLNTNKVTDPRVLLNDDQYQIFYQTDEAPKFWTCPPTAECVYVPQECR
jgi:hypothetical protein